MTGDRAVPVLILGKGKLNREAPWGMGKEGDTEPGSKNWWKARGVLAAPPEGFLGLCSTVEKRQTPSHLF